jgi:type II restriction/modification system DNA methylase subunit YeeA
LNTTALKTFAPSVRTQLIEAVTRKLDFVLTGDTAELRAMSAQRATLRREADHNRSGLIERVAYTWFNRLIALRFLDAHGWHPFGARVLTAANTGESLPELLKVMRTGALPSELASFTSPKRLNDLLDGHIRSADPQGEVYRQLVLAACRFYHDLLPNLFEKLDDETELLLPDDLLTEHSVVHGFRTEIYDADCAEVEVLGWLYQFYISEKKDQVMARKSAVPTEDIPAVTQLFTPHWIVRYLVENSLGHLWLLNRPGSRLREHMPYYIEGEPETDFLKITKPEEIRMCDPAVGSGHMLTYAFDLLTLIYEDEGYAPTEIPALILRHNLHGLEICPRAAQLAELALVFKAREKSRRFFQPEHIVRPNILELREVRFDEGELSAYFKALGAQPSTLHTDLIKLLYQFEEAKNFGSLIQPCLTEQEVQHVRSEIGNRQSKIANSQGQLFLRETHLKVLRVLEQSEALTQQYHVVVANPPYMGGKGMNANMRELGRSLYPESKSDLFSMFIERVGLLVLSQGWTAMVTMQSWMFLSSYHALRVKLLAHQHLQTLIQIGYNSFPELNSKVAQACAFVFVNAKRNKRGACLNLNDAPQASDKDKVFVSKLVAGDISRVNQSNFSKIPGSPIAYWVTDKVFDVFEAAPSFVEKAAIKNGMSTTDNDRFTRLWHEIGRSNIGFRIKSADAAFESRKKWFPYNKGGEYRRWYGNMGHLVNWFENGRQVKKAAEGASGGRIVSEEYFFSSSLSWTKVSSGLFAVRYYDQGFLFDVAGPSIFCDEKKNFFYAALLNSRINHPCLQQLSPTINYEVGQVSAFPIVDSKSCAETVSDNATQCITIARADWDNFETSWDFRDQPLLRSGLKGATLKASWQNWEAQSTAAIRRMLELETENNRLFIAAYGLDGELQPEVPEEQITLAHADARRDMVAWISYAVGCMMGRFGLDQPGLILADAGDTLANYLTKVGKPADQLTFAPDEDGIIPVLDGEWFEDDIVARTRDFLRVTFGEATLSENLRFIEKSLGKDLRKYFQTDFYKNHLQTYKKRPIYWLFRSPKGAFSALVYLHRMTRDTPNLILNCYLRNYLVKLRARIEHLDHAQAAAATAKEKTVARKESDQLKKNLRECEEWERDVLLPLAQSRPELDLDDGVKVNYLKLGEALAPIPGLAAAEDE